jgi:hypothetical protein
MEAIICSKASLQILKNITLHLTALQGQNFGGFAHRYILRCRSTIFSNYIIFAVNVKVVYICEKGL